MGGVPHFLDPCLWVTTWPFVGRVAIFLAAAYLVLLTLIRLFGPRTISKMNPSDFIITMSIGSTFATMLLAKEVSLVDGLVALTALVLLMYQGHFLRHNMRVNNVSEQEVLASLRAHQTADPADVEPVVLEIDGDLSVLPRQQRDAPVPRDVRRRS